MAPNEYRPRPKYGAFSSSVDPNKLAATISGIIKIVASSIIMIGGAQIAPELNQLGDSVTQLGAQVAQIMAMLTAAYGTVETIIGICRKIAVWAGSRFQGGG